MKKVIWSLLLLLVGSVLCYIAYKEYQRENALEKTSSKVEAVVIENRKSGKSYHPILAYTYKEVSYKEQASNSGAKPPIYSVGDRVTVYINSENPADIEIKSFFNQKGKPLILLFFGTLCLYASIQVLRFKKP